VEKVRGLQELAFQLGLEEGCRNVSLLLNCSTCWGVFQGPYAWLTLHAILGNFVETFLDALCAVSANNVSGVCLGGLAP